jgi:hypothetical protein
LVQIGGHVEVIDRILFAAVLNTSFAVKKKRCQEKQKSIFEFAACKLLQVESVWFFNIVTVGDDVAYEIII